MSGLRRDKLDWAGRERAGLFEMCDVEELAWHAACLEADIANLRAVLEMIAKASPIEEPTRGDFSGNADDDYSAGLERGAWGLSQIARKSLGGEA